MSNSTDKYRFNCGSLYVFDSEANAYVHCWKNAFDNTKRKAIVSYEEYLLNCEKEEAVSQWS